MQTQNERLKDHLELVGEVDAMYAWKYLAIYRLASRIKDLRNQGMNIVTERVEVLNRFDEKCKVARYRLA